MREITPEEKATVERVRAEIARRRAARGPAETSRLDEIHAELMEGWAEEERDRAALTATEPAKDGS